MTDDTPSSPPPSPVASSFGGINELALQMARKWNAIDDAGALWCILCNDRPGALPHLCCGPCISEWRRRHG